jgi:hypothetical protein
MKRPVSECEKRKHSESGDEKQKENRNNVAKREFECYCEQM